MHALYFELKSAHLRTVAFGQQLVEKVRHMTPARFDLLCLIRDVARRDLPEALWRDFDKPVAMKYLYEQLGLHPTTVGRMLCRLQELGWVSCGRNPDDQRCVLVELTRLGHRRIWEASRRVFRGRGFLRKFEQVARSMRPTLHVLDALDDTFDVVNMIAASFGDTSKVLYDWGSRERYRFDPRPRPGDDQRTPQERERLRRTPRIPEPPESDFELTDEEGTRLFGDKWQRYKKEDQEKKKKPRLVPDTRSTRRVPEPPESDFELTDEEGTRLFGDKWQRYKKEDEAKRKTKTKRRPAPGTWLDPYLVALAETEATEVKLAAVATTTDSAAIVGETREVGPSLLR